MKEREIEKRKGNRNKKKIEKKGKNKTVTKRRNFESFTKRTKIEK